MTVTHSVYAVYLTAATGTHPAGYVVNNIMWDGASTLALPTGQAVVADAARKYPIGSTYTAPTATPATTATTAGAGTT